MFRLLNASSLSLAAALFLGGCSVFTPPKGKPVIEDRVSDWGVSKVGVLATTAERRVVLVVMPQKKFCAEAPPDVGESISSSLGASLDAQGAGKVTSAELQLRQQMASSILQLSHRSQGLELYRASSFFLCTLFLNGVIDAKDLVLKHDTLLTNVVGLIGKEIPEIAEIKGSASLKLERPLLNTDEDKMKNGEEKDTSTK